MDPSVAFILHENIHKLPRGHVTGDFGETKGRTEASFQIVADPGSFAAILWILIFRVFDEVASAFAVAAWVDTSWGVVSERESSVKCPAYAATAFVFLP